MAPSNSPTAASGALDQCAIGALVVGRYLIEKKLGQGGMGAVYLGRDRRLLDKRVVVKVLLGEFVGDEWVIRKFLQEKEALTRANHPGIVGILDAGELPDGKPFLVMEFIDGVTLHEALPPGGMDLKRAGNLLRQIGSALAAAHNNGIYHRDLKPENIMLQCLTGNEEQVRIIDFGIAKVHNSLVSEHTVAGRFGTYVYMSPEQFRMEQITAASDVYSMGAIAYEVVTGQAPFNPRSFKNLGDMYSAGVKVAPRELRRELPERAQKLILKALSPRPQDRFQNAVEFGDALAQALSENRNIRERAASWKGVLKRRQVQASSPRESPGQVNSAQVTSAETTPPEDTMRPPPEETMRPAISANSTLPLPSSAQTVPQANLRQPRFGRGSLVRVGLPVAVVVVAALAVVALASLVALVWGGSKKSDNKPAFESPVKAPPGTANTAPATATRNSLTYWLTVHKARRGKALTFESSGEEVFERGDEFELNVSAANSGYLYVLGEGASDNGSLSFTILHPFTNDPSAKLDSGKTAQVGGKFSGKAGIDQLWIVWSAMPMTDLEAARDSALKIQSQGRITDQAVVGKVRELLASSVSSEVIKDNSNHRTVIAGYSDLLLKRLELEHR
jgi:serine/threonine-protein kinase